jgi:hypothetical protein
MAMEVGGGGGGGEVLFDEQHVVVAAEKDSMEYLLLRGWCVPWVPGDSNEDAQLAALLDDTIDIDGPLRRCVSADQQAVGADWLNAALEAAAPRLLDIAVNNDDVEMFVALRPWSEKLRRAQLMAADACRGVWLDWTVQRNDKLLLLIPSERDMEEDAELRKAAVDAWTEHEQPPKEAQQLVSLPTPALPWIPLPNICGWIAAVTLLTLFVLHRRN